MTVSSSYDTQLEESVYIFPTSFAQQSLWFLDQLEPNSATYNIPSSIHISGPFNVLALEQSLHEIIQRHEVLRTTFRAMEGQPMQVVTPTLTVPLPLVDLQNLPHAEREDATRRLATEEARRPFDLAQGPLVRTTLLRLGAEEHVLLLTMHHIISDGWSTGVFLQELAALYKAFSTDRPSPLSELPIQYVDFTIWQREWLQGKVLEAQLAYWKQQMEGASANLQLPIDHPRSLVQTRRGSRYLFTLSRPLTDALKALSRQEDVTLYMTLLAAFNTLLARYTAQDDIVIGSPTAGRVQAETEHLIGFFINTLVLRTDLSGNPTFRQLLERVREVSLEAQAHQDVPFEYLVKELQPERELGQNPLFQVMLSLQPSHSVLPAGWTLTQKEIDTNTSKFDLSLDFEDYAEGLIGRFEYRTDLFDAATIERMAGHLHTLLEGIVDDPEQHLSALPLLTEAERQQLLITWNPTSTTSYTNQRIHQLFEAQVERTSNAIALVLEEQQMTYQELNTRANQLAHRLQRLGVGPEVLVGICVERSLEMVVALLAVLKAGGAFVPLDPTSPQERMAFMLQDSQVAVLLTQQHLIDRLPKHTIQVICLDTDWQIIAQERADNLPNTVTPENLAYVIYTSGSTGQPKGVLIPHSSIANHCCAITKYYELDSSDHVLQFSTFTFDASLEQILPTLIVGARLILRGPEVWSTTEFYEKLLSFELTVINLPTAYWQQLAQEWSTAHKQFPRTQLRLVIIGGDRMLPEHLSLWWQLPMHSVRLLNAYGPTETTITATTFEILPDSRKHLSLASIPIGRPLAHRTVYILDTHANPVPIGVPGELHIGGDLLARGYLNRPELTVERFIPDSFREEPNAHLYKTGDLARYLPDGNIEFLGRADHQVKIRGFRIELGEIEAVLNRHPAVREAIVVAREDVPGDMRLVAYVVLHNEQNAITRELQRHVMQHLPTYMLPSAFVVLEALPLTPNGKVDRRNLPMPSSDRTIEEETFVAPTLMLHYQLIQIWEELLDTRPIGIRDDFFALGGHSLLATRMVNRIEQVFGKKLPLNALFAGPTIEHLAHVLEQQEEVTDQRSPFVAIQTSGSKRPFFFLHGDYEGGAFYCIPLAHALGADQPFYALHPFRFDNLLVPPTFEEIASTHIETLRAVQPEGPYLLGGFCGGGLVAYEMARQLQAQGDTVDFLVLMGPTPIAYLRPRRTTINHVGNLLRLNEEKQLTFFLWLRHVYHYSQHLYRYLRFSRYRKLKPKQNSEQVHPKGSVILALKTLHELWLSHGVEQPERNEQTEAGHKRNKAHVALPKLNGLFPDPIFPTAESLRHDWGGMFLWTTSVYEPSFYPGKSTFFFFQDSEEHQRGKPWRKVAKAKDKEVEIHIVPATHDSSKTVDLHNLTNYLHICLSNVQEGDGE
ncbi:MAG: hypothetical protein NVSMB49_08130 [Ktedonobacteraceae bacterium]